MVLGLNRHPIRINLFFCHPPTSRVCVSAHSVHKTKYLTNGNHLPEDVDLYQAFVHVGSSASVALAFSVFLRFDVLCEIGAVHVWRRRLPTSCRTRTCWASRSLLKQNFVAYVMFSAAPNQHALVYALTIGSLLRFLTTLACVVLFLGVLGLWWGRQSAR